MKGFLFRKSMKMIGLLGIGLGGVYRGKANEINCEDIKKSKIENIGNLNGQRAIYVFDIDLLVQ